MDPYFNMIDIVMAIYLFKGFRLGSVYVLSPIFSNTAQPTSLTDSIEFNTMMRHR